MTLAEFVLARVAEREEKARIAAPLFPAILGPEALNAYLRLHQPSAVLADCEAQRWVVQEAARAEAPGSCYGWEEGYAEGEWSMAQAVLRLMALRHADHPDYDESWRP